MLTLFHFLFNLQYGGYDYPYYGGGMGGYGGYGYGGVSSRLFRLCVLTR